VKNCREKNCRFRSLVAVTAKTVPLYHNVPFSLQNTSFDFVLYQVVTLPLLVDLDAVYAEIACHALRYYC